MISKYTVYILYSNDYDKFYIGQTNNFERRFEEHNKGQNKSTKAYIPWEVLLTLPKDTRYEALRLENKIKNLSKDRILKFIEKYG